jgi:hypothetical protein
MASRISPAWALVMRAPASALDSYVCFKFFGHVFPFVVVASV